MSRRRNAFAIAIAIASTLAPLVACAATIQPPAGSPNPESLRPRPINLNNIDPCSLLTSAQAQDLDVRDPTTTAAKGDRGPFCQWSPASDEPLEGYLIETQTEAGIEAALDNPLGIVHTTVLNYPAIEATGLHADPTINCGVLVDVAPGQMLITAYSYDDRTLPMNHEIACTKARAAAEMAMQTLIQKSG